MLEKVKTTVAQYNMLNFGDNVLIGLSGGADSVALLLALLQLKKEYNLTLTALHVNHNLRGKEALRDQNFCKELCAKLSVEFICESVDVAERAKLFGESTELAARNLRYSAFSKYANGRIATAHNADDNVETVVFNLCRGASLNGLCGIPPVRGNIIRPLIKCDRNCILNFLKENGQNYVTDSTNNTDDYTRNKIRHNILPLLKDINGGAIENIARNCDSLRIDAEYLNTVADTEYEKYCKDSVLFKDVAILPDAVLRRVLAIFYRKNVGDSPDSLHLLEMKKVVTGDIARTSLQKDLFFFKCDNGFTVSNKKTMADFSLSFEGNFLENIKKCEKFTKITAFVGDFKKINKKLFKYSIDCDKISGVVTVRSRKNGDKFRPVGRNVTKSVGKLLTEYKCSEFERDSLIIICDEKGIIYTSLFGIDERVKPNDTSKNIVIIEN